MMSLPSVLEVSSVFVIFHEFLSTSHSLFVTSIVFKNSETTVLYGLPNYDGKLITESEVILWQEA